jgi:hypothetical protein
MSSQINFSQFAKKADRKKTAWSNISAALQLQFQIGAIFFFVGKKTSKARCLGSRWQRGKFPSSLSPSLSLSLSLDLSPSAHFLTDFSCLSLIFTPAAWPFFYYRALSQEGTSTAAHPTPSSAAVRGRS